MDNRVVAAAEYNAEFAMDVMLRAAELAGSSPDSPTDGTLTVDALLRTWQDHGSRKSMRPGIRRALFLPLGTQDIITPPDTAETKNPSPTKPDLPLMTDNPRWRSLIHPGPGGEGAWRRRR